MSKVGLPSHDPAYEWQQRRAAIVFLAVLAGMIVVSALVAYVMLGFRPLPEGAPAAGQQGPASADASRPGPPVSAPGASPATPLGALPGTAPDPAAAAADQGVSVELHPSGECRVRVIADGKTVLDRTMRRGERQTVRARDAAVLSVGDAALCAFSIDGRPARPLGSAGEARTVRISRDSAAGLVR